MACDACFWCDEAERADDIALTLPEWMTENIALAESIAHTIREIEHATDRQKQVLDNLERKIE